MIEELKPYYWSSLDPDGKNKEALIAAENAYENLSASEKEQVKNSSKLKEARKTCDLANLSDHLSTLGKGRARQMLKTPSSFELIDESIYVYLDPNTEKAIGAYALIQFSGTNDFGGRKDNYSFFYWTIDESGKIYDYEGLGTDFDKLMESQNAIKKYMK